MANADRTVPLLPRRRLVGLSFGGLTSARRGPGSDVAGSRPYQPGDDVDTIDWNASARLFASDLCNAFALFGREARKLAGRAVGVQTVYALFDQPIDESPELRLVYLPALVQRDECGREDAL